MSKVYVFFADGFEEIEGLTVVDVLRRAKIEVEMVSVTGKKTVTGSHQIPVEMDLLFENIEASQADMLVLPGGMPGTLTLGAHAGLAELLGQFYQEKKWLAAICAAPTIFGKMGFLKGREAICYPGMEDQLTGAVVVKQPVAEDGPIITGRGMGAAIPFALKLVEKLQSAQTAQKIGESIVYYA